MRSLFLFLLLLNVLYALWQWQIGGWQLPVMSHPQHQAPVDLPSDEDVPLSSVALGSSPLVPAKPIQTDTASALCVMLGTFGVRAEAEQLQQRLRALDVAAELMTLEEVAATDYWLVMSVSGGNQGALARLSMLQERGIDSFVITRGALAGNLSLGVFSQRDYAAARKAQLEAEGYDVRVEAVEKTREQYRLQVPPSGRRLLDQAMLSRLRTDFPAMQHQYQACAGIAKGANIP